jgi:hypothetical protein
MMKLIRLSLLVFAFMLSGAAFGQSNLPACQGSEVSRWSNCSGSWTASNGYKYVGEWKDGKQNGQGTFTFADGEKYVGEFKDGKYNGQGTLTFAKGDKYVGEDIVFFRKMQASGIPSYAHTGALVRHMKRFSLDASYYDMYWTLDTIKKRAQEKQQQG